MLSMIGTNRNRMRGPRNLDAEASEPRVSMPLNTMPKPSNGFMGPGAKLRNRSQFATQKPSLKGLATIY